MKVGITFTAFVWWDRSVLSAHYATGLASPCCLSVWPSVCLLRPSF